MSNEYNIIGNFISRSITIEDNIAIILNTKNQRLHFSDRIEYSESSVIGSNFIIKNGVYYRIVIRIPIYHVNIINNNTEFAITKSNDENIYSSDSKDIFVYGYKTKYNLIYYIEDLIKQFQNNNLFFNKICIYYFRHDVLYKQSSLVEPN
jgi:hypothetical protein